MYATTTVSCIYSLVFPKMNKTRKKDWKIRKVRAWWPGDTHPHDQSLQPSTHITHWNWSSANGADTCGHRKGRPERHRPPGLPSGEGERTKPPSRGSCAFCWGGGRSLWGSHTQFRAMLGLWALQREDGGRDGARGVHSASPTPSLSSQLKAKPAPPPRPFPQSKRLTSRSRPALSSRKDAAQRPAGNVVHRERETGPPQRSAQAWSGCEGLEASGCDLGSTGRAWRLRCPFPQTHAPNLAHWAGGCVVALPGLRIPIITLSHA